MSAGGLQAIMNQQKEQEAKERMGQELREKQLNAAKTQMATFQKKLEEFARKYKKQIKTDPDMRRDFNTMCLQIGVDPLQSKNGFWSKILGVGDFYHELSIKVIDVCSALKKNAAGGMIPLDDVLTRVKKTYGSKSPKISKDDIEQSLKNLRSIGEGYSVVKIGKQYFIKIVSFDLDNDSSAVLELAKDTGYFVDQGNLGWDQERFQKAVRALLQEGFIWTDEVEGQPKRYYVCALFPGFN
ncbi:Vacuolar-sorting protein SNF8 [Histomonas meleagridis]|uniref:Vacuolar-sorting protein SNF8 n=1 Tax=Histomonas meleagridis TaxID=135588 RepID=UPI00355952F2|nr:Vacuolar-sorting protein SNF8 [Histomonas meleagridis]KAH0800929.1 Vacuolar-sorting protein SNF8 [Histomonas meleagridis]